MKSLLFVYNADAGFFSVAADMAHKIFSPSTYPCSLCGITYGIFSIRPEWEAFVNAAPLPLVFLHRDEFHQQYPEEQNRQLPVVLIADNGVLQEGISATALNRMKSVAELRTVVEGLY